MNVIGVKDLEMEEGPGLSRWVQANYMSPYRQEAFSAASREMGQQQRQERHEV